MNFYFRSVQTQQDEVSAQLEVVTGPLGRMVNMFNIKYHVLIVTFGNLSFTDNLHRQS